METIDWLIEGDFNKFTLKEWNARTIAIHNINVYWEISSIDVLAQKELHKKQLTKHFNQLIRLNLKSLILLRKVLNLPT